MLNTEIVVPWKEFNEVTEEKFLSMFSIVAVVKNPSCRPDGQTNQGFGILHTFVKLPDLQFHQIWYS